MGPHHQKSDQRPQGRRKSGAENPHIKRKYKDIVTGNVKNPSGENTRRGKPRIPVVSQKAASIWLKRNSGTANLTGSRYLLASGSSVSSAPNSVRS